MNIARPSTPQETFSLYLQTVVGQAFNAAGYALEENMAAHMGGLFRYIKPFESGAFAGLYGIIEFQMLHYIEAASRFRVTLLRVENAQATNSRHPLGIRRDLAALVVDDFGVAVLPSASHWWQYQDVNTLGRALAEAGHLIIGYGMPWLAGELVPPGTGA